jgi:hypothetical protein
MRYGSSVRTSFKIRWNLSGLVHDHHVIPKQFKIHPVVHKYGYDIHASSNIIMMPTLYGKHVLNVREDRLVHSGPHRKYNSYVEFMLNSIKSEDDLIMFVSFLKESCRFKSNRIPW